MPEVFVEQPTIEFGRNYIGGIAKMHVTMVNKSPIMVGRCRLTR